MVWSKAILITIICGLWAFGGVWIIKPNKEWTMFVWAIFFSIFMLGYEGLILYRFIKEKKAKDILDGKRPIEP